MRSMSLIIHKMQLILNKKGLKYDFKPFLLFYKKNYFSYSFDVILRSDAKSCKIGAAINTEE